MTVVALSTGCISDQPTTAMSRRQYVAPSDTAIQGETITEDDIVRIQKRCIEIGLETSDRILAQSANWGGSLNAANQAREKAKNTCLAENGLGETESQ